MDLHGGARERSQGAKTTRSPSQTLNPMNSKLETLNPRPKIRNPKPEARKPKPETRNPKPETLKPEAETINPKPETRNLKPEILHSTPGLALSGDTSPRCGCQQRLCGTHQGPFAILHPVISLWGLFLQAASSDCAARTKEHSAWKKISSTYACAFWLAPLAAGQAASRDGVVSYDS